VFSLFLVVVWSTVANATFDARFCVGALDSVAFKSALSRVLHELETSKNPAFDENVTERGDLISSIKSSQNALSTKRQELLDTKAAQDSSILKWRYQSKILKLESEIATLDEAIKTKEARLEEISPESQADFYSTAVRTRLREILSSSDLSNASLPIRYMVHGKYVEKPPGGAHYQDYGIMYHDLSDLNKSARNIINYKISNRELISSIGTKTWSFDKIEFVVRDSHGLGGWLYDVSFPAKYDYTGMPTSLHQAVFLIDEEFHLLLGDPSRLDPFLFKGVGDSSVEPGSHNQNVAIPFNKNALLPIAPNLNLLFPISDFKVAESDFAAVKTAVDEGRPIIVQFDKGKENSAKEFRREILARFSLENSRDFSTVFINSRGGFDLTTKSPPFQIIFLSENIDIEPSNGWYKKPLILHPQLQ